MLEEIGLAILLVVAGLVFRRRVAGAWWPASWFGPPLAWAGWRDRLKNLGRRRCLAPTLAHPASEAGILLIACIAFIWLSEVTVLGWTKMSTFAPEFRQTGACWAFQRWEAEHGDYLSAWALGNHVGNALPNPATTCPVGGRYLVDKEGYITCTRHGRASGARNVIPPDMLIPRDTAKAK